MSVTKRIAFGAAATWFSRGVSILMGLVLLPVLFRHLPKAELGVWLLLGQSWAALGIFDLGFGATLTRRIAFAKGKSGSDPAVQLTDETLVEIADLVATGKRVYRGLAIFAFAFSIAAGFFYLRTLHLGGVSLSRVWLAWGGLCLSQGFGVWANVWNCVLLGVGYVGWDAVLASIASSFTLLAQIIAVLLGGGLVTLAIIAAVGAVTQRFLLLGFARSRRPEIFAIRGRWSMGLVRSMSPVAVRAWLTTLGVVLATQTDQFFVASFRGTTALPAYRAAFVVLVNMNMLSVTFAGASAVFISHLWQASEIAQIHRIMTRNLRLGLGMMACGGACVLALGPRLFDLWLSPGNFIGYRVLIVFFIGQFLEVQAFIISTGSRATEDEAFASWSLGAGIFKIILSLALGTRYGLLGIALGSLVASSATTHWYMAYRGLHRLKFGLRRHLQQVLSGVVVLFVLTLGVVYLETRLLGNNPPAVQVVVGLLVGGGLLGLYVWLTVFSVSERSRVLTRASQCARRVN